jgi:hypothetical protein
MRYLSINYDLRAPGRNYDRLYQRLREYPGVVRVLQSLWIVSTAWTARQVHDDLRRFLDANDGLFVVRVTNEVAWSGIDPTASDRLRKNLPLAA